MNLPGNCPLPCLITRGSRYLLEPLPRGYINTLKWQSMYKESSCLGTTPINIIYGIAYRISISIRYIPAHYIPYFP
jgi:hypothetical protein